MKNSFVFYLDWWQNIAELPTEQRLSCFDAICQYAFNGKVPTDPTIKAITGLMRSALDRDTEKWQVKSEKRKAAAEARWHKDKYANASFASSCIGLHGVNVNVNGNVNGNGNGNVNDNDNDKNINVPKGTCVSLSEASDFQKLQRWINKELKHVAKIEKQITEKELTTLLSKYDKNVIFDTLKDMDNYHRAGKPVEKCYTSVYRTLCNWLSRSTPKN